MRRVTLWVLGLALLVGSGSGTWADAGADAAAIRARLEQWRQAFNARDAAGACDLFAPDLAYSVPGVLQGDHARMCGNIRTQFAKPGLRLSYGAPEIHEISVTGSIGVVRLRWTLTTEVDGRRTVTTEEGLDIFTRQPDGRWSISRFMAF